ncbi:MAG: M23 family metallopeptidase, partial [Alphaproteobacteria bacterium]
MAGRAFRSTGVACFLAAAVIVSAGSATLAQTMSSPVGKRSISANFFDPGYAATEARQHLGTDFAAPAGTMVLSPVSGRIVINRSDAADVMAAYVVVRAPDGVEHVLGHIMSPQGEGTTIKAGQQIGTVRQWPGQPGRSHLHWGMNRLGVVQAMAGGWGWGRAPVSATRAQASARGWANVLTASSSADEQARPVRSLAATNSGMTCSHLVSEAQFAAIAKSRSIEPVLNKVVLDRRNVINWNGTPVNRTRLFQYVDITSTMNPVPYLIFNIED